MKCKQCGRTISNSGKVFTMQSLEQHIRDAHTKKTSGRFDIPRFPLTDMIADDDMPDGAYFALAWELGEL